MAPRVSVLDVESIMGEQTFSLVPFINTANVIVNNYLLGKMSEEVLTEVERYLAAHLACVRADRAVYESIGDASVKYMRTIGGPGMASTDFGQIVLQLDTSGTLAESEKPGASIYAPDVLTRDV